MKIKDKIYSRGYWLAIIRPSTFIEDRISDIADLYTIIEKNVVKFRGWDYPHLDYDSRHIDKDWIGEDFQWEHHITSWRFYQSGLFCHLSGMRMDWRDESSIWNVDENWEPCTHLGIGQVIYQYSEILELASRLSMSKAGGNQMYIRVEVGNLKNRQLYMDDSRRVGLFGDYQTKMGKFPYEIEISKSDLISNSGDIAVDASAELLKRFNWDIEKDRISSLQEEYINRYSFH